MSALGQKRTLPKLRECVYLRLDQRLPEGGVDDPLKKAKEKAAATYDAAADHLTMSRSVFGIAVASAP